MADCLPPSFGTGPWGTMPWGGEGTSLGGALPTTELFDIYCFGPCGPMAGIVNQPEVTVLETGAQFVVDGASSDLVITSGGAVSTEPARLFINTAVPSKFTVEWTVLFQSLPPNFGSLDTNHVFLGAFDAQGVVVGLFFSRVGIAYSGSVHFAAGHLVLDGPLQILPGSSELVTEGEYWTVRVAADVASAVTYIYVTKTSLLNTMGHQLRFILPALTASSMALVPPDVTTVSVRGTAALSSSLFLDMICLGAGLLLPSIAPFADASAAGDQAVLRCTVAQLHGEKSFSPQGAPLRYQWRLIDAPLPSQYRFEGYDGRTRPLVARGENDPPSFTDRLYSDSLGDLQALDPVLAGDVLLVGGKVYVLSDPGIDTHGFYFRIQGYVLPDNLDGAPFVILRQRGISNPRTAKPTFYPDVVGLYKFDLVVFDGNLFSQPSITVLNVTSSPVARGMAPDLRFLWNYLSDFWRLVEDRERIEVYWSGLAQIAAAELLTLWQIDYSKSLRDIQRTFQRRWLHYDFLMTESLFELSTVQAPLAGMNPTTGLLQGAGYGTGPRSYKVDRSLLSFAIGEGDFLVLQGVAYRIARVVSAVGDEFKQQQLSLLDDIPVPAPTHWAVSGKATSRTLDFDAALVVAGDLVTLEVVEASTGGILDLETTVLGTSSTEPMSLAIDATGLGPYLLNTDFAVTLKSVLRRTYLPLDPLVVDVPYLQEKIRPTDDTETLRRNVDYFFERFRGELCLRFVVGDAPSPDVWQHEKPPVRLWAETTYLDNRPTIEGNFGIPADFTLDDLSLLPSNIDYLSSVRGLWYAYFNGPTLFNLKAGTQILLGLPFAEEAGTLEEIRTDFSSTEGRLLVRDTANSAVVRSYSYPSSLHLETNPTTGVPYVVGDAVSQFAPLVTGVEVLDYVKDPTWFRGYLQQGTFFEVEKYFKFLVRVDSAAFNLAALLFVQSFIRRIKPTYTQPLFVVLASLGMDGDRDGTDAISTTDAVSLFARLLLNDLGVTHNAFDMSTMIDQGNPAGGGWVSQTDTDSDPSTPLPTYPVADLVLWGRDKNYLAPEDVILARATMVMPHMEPPFFTGGTPSPLPFLDGLFRSDLPLFSALTPALVFQDSNVFGVPQGPAGYIMEPNPLIGLVAGTVDHLLCDIIGDPGSDSLDYELILEVDGADFLVQPFTAGPGGAVIGVAIALSVGVGTVLRLRLRPATGGVRRPNWETVMVQLSTQVPWATDTPMPAGTYGAVFAM